MCLCQSVCVGERRGQAEREVSLLVGLGSYPRGAGRLSEGLSRPWWGDAFGSVLDRVRGAGGLAGAEGDLDSQAARRYGEVHPLDHVVDALGCCRVGRERGADDHRRPPRVQRSRVRSARRRRRRERRAHHAAAFPLGVPMSRRERRASSRHDAAAVSLRFTSQARIMDGRDGLSPRSRCGSASLRSRVLRRG